MMARCGIDDADQVVVDGRREVTVRGIVEVTSDAKFSTLSKVVVGRSERRGRSERK